MRYSVLLVILLAFLAGCTGKDAETSTLYEKASEAQRQAYNACINQVTLSNGNAILTVQNALLSLMKDKKNYVSEHGQKAYDDSVAEYKNTITSLQNTMDESKKTCASVLKGE